MTAALLSIGTASGDDLPVGTVPIPIDPGIGTKPAPEGSGTGQITTRTYTVLPSDNGPCLDFAAIDGNNYFFTVKQEVRLDLVADGAYYGYAGALGPRQYHIDQGLLVDDENRFVTGFYPSFTNTHTYTFQARGEGFAFDLRYEENGAWNAIDADNTGELRVSIQGDLSVAANQLGTCLKV